MKDPRDLKSLTMHDVDLTTNIYTFSVMGCVCRITRAFYSPQCIFRIARDNLTSKHLSSMNLVQENLLHRTISIRNAEVNV